MKIIDIYNLIDDVFPFNTQCEWDNSGILVGNINDELTGVLLALDVTDNVIESAISNKYNLIVTHHPIIFAGLNNVLSDSLVYKCIKNNINVISAHTNFDKGYNGINYMLAKKLGLNNIEFINEDELGIIGEVAEQIEALKFSENVKKIFGLSCVKISNNTNIIKRVAICSGSGSSYLKYLNKVDLFISSEFKHNHFIDAKISLLDVSHYEIEKLAMHYLKDILNLQVEVNVSECDIPYLFI